MTSPTTPTPSTTVRKGGATGLSSLHTEVVQAHILTRLDGPTLASTSCASPTLRALSSQDHLWSHICNSTWPSTAVPSVRQLISAFPGGARRFFSRCFPIPDPSPLSSPDRPSPPELISAVDIHYQKKLIFSKVQQTETETGWFRCSPFRIDMLGPKDFVPTEIVHPDGEETCQALVEDMTLSWILIDPVGREAANMSSHKPVSVQRHWLSGEVQVRFASILAADLKGTAEGVAQCVVVVTCGESEGGETQVSEVRMEVEDIDGMHLNGKESMVILKGAMEGKRGKGKRREEEGRRRYREFVEKKKQRRERKLKREGTFDVLCVAFGVSFSAAFWFLLFFR